jgi:hypothetical protein
MKNYFNERVAKKLLIAGGIVFAVSYVLNLVTASSIYGKVDDCLDKTVKCTLKTEQNVGDVATIIGYVGIALFLIGLALLLIVLMKNKKKV